MEAFIHRENLALFKKKLAGAKDEATREVLRKLIAAEEAKPPPTSKVPGRR